MNLSAFPDDWQPNGLGITIARYCYTDEIGHVMGGEIMLWRGCSDGGFYLARYRDGAEVSLEITSQEQISHLVKNFHPKNMEILAEHFLDFPNAADYEQQTVFLRAPQYIKKELVKAAEDADLSLNQWCMEALVNSLPKNRAGEIARREIFGRPSSCSDEESPEFLKLVEEAKAALRAAEAQRIACVNAAKAARGMILSAIDGGQTERVQ
jgi:predicted HicB family RNase H-like nuclease